MLESYTEFSKILLEYLDKAQALFQQTRDGAKERTAIDILREKIERQQYNITLIGSLKRGKSTLINVLMTRCNDDLSPVQSAICTSTIVKYIDKTQTASTRPQEEAIVYFYDNVTLPQSVPLSRLRDYITESGNPGNKKGVCSVEVRTNFPVWLRPIVLVDTPGQNSVFNYHDTLLINFLPMTEAIVFLIAADIPLDGGDLALLNKLSKNQCKKIFFVLTKTDALDPEDLPDVLDYVNSQLDQAGFASSPVYSVAAKPVYEALCQNEPEDVIDQLKQKYGIAALEEALERFIARESQPGLRIRQLSQAAISKVRQSCEDFLIAVRPHLLPSGIEQKDLEQLNKEFQQANQLFRRKRDTALNELNQAWEIFSSQNHEQLSQKLKSICLGNTPNENPCKELFQILNKLEHILQSAVRSFETNSQNLASHIGELNQILQLSLPQRQWDLSGERQQFLETIQETLEAMIQAAEAVVQNSGFQLLEQWLARHIPVTVETVSRILRNYKDSLISEFYQNIDILLESNYQVLIKISSMLKQNPDLLKQQIQQAETLIEESYRLQTLLDEQQ